MQSVYDWFRWLNDAHGINLTIVYDDFDRGRFLRGMRTSASIVTISIVASIVIGVLGAWLQGARLALVRHATQAVIQFFRNTPPLVQMYFFYFALGGALNRYAQAQELPFLSLSGMAWACIALSFFAAAFNVEIFRSGLEAVPRPTVEAAEALGYTRLQVYRYVLLPLAMRVCLPALNNNLVNLTKTTTLSYAIAVPEVLFVSAQIWSDSINVLEMMLVLFAFFMVLVGIVVLAMTRLEKALAIPGYGAR